MKKKSLVFLLSAMVVVSLVGCNQSGNVVEGDTQELVENLVEDDSDTETVDVTDGDDTVENDGPMEFTIDAGSFADLYKITLNDVEYELGDPVQKFLDNGWELDSKVGAADQDSNPMYPGWYFVQLKQTGSDDFIRVFMSSPVYDVSFKDCYYEGIIVNCGENNGGESTTSNTTFTLNGISLNDNISVEDIQAAFPADAPKSRIDTDNSKANKFYYGYESTGGSDYRDFLCIVTDKDNNVMGFSMTGKNSYPSK